MFKKIIGIILVLAGIGGVISGEVLSALLMVVAGILLLKNKSIPKKTKWKEVKLKGTKETSNQTISPIITKPTYEKHFFFNVVGITKKNDRGQDIQKIIKEFVKEQLEYMEEPYQGYTNKEILEYGEDVYEVDIYGYDEISLIPEPDNQYDSNAIKVIHEEIGHIGYVPREYTDRVKTALRNDYEIEWKLVGGKLKYVDYDEYKVRTKTLNYGVMIDVYYNIKAKA